MFDLLKAKEEIQRSEKVFYVYVMYKPSGMPFYVGKGTKQERDHQRITYHEQEARANGDRERQPHLNRHKINTISKIWQQGKEVLYSIDSWHDEEEACYLRERELIRSLGRRITGDGPLTNLTEGGEKEMTTISSQTREQISASLKRYYLENPQAIQKMAERNKKYFEDHPEAVEKARENAIKNQIANTLIDWMANPDNLKQRGQKHSEFLKQWHASEEGKDATKNAAAKRNEKFRTEEHRQHMAQKTAEYIKNNPEADKARREKARQTMLRNRDFRQEVLSDIQDKLFRDGKIKKKAEYISSAMVYKWKKRGLIPKNF